MSYNGFSREQDWRELLDKNSVLFYMSPRMNGCKTRRTLISHFSKMWSRRMATVLNQVAFHQRKIRVWDFALSLRSCMRLRRERWNALAGR